MSGPRSWLAEAIGTYALVFFGPLSIALAFGHFGEQLNTATLVFVSLAHGGIIALVVYSFGHVSGAHINPAVTIPMVVTRQLGAREGAAYVGSQLAGAAAASATLLAVAPGIGSAVNLGVQTGPSEILGGSAASGLAFEALMTFFFVAVIFMTAVHKRASPALSGATIGGMAFIIHLVGIPLTGASINPARTFGPALVSGYWDFHWMYWAGPLAGGILGALAMYYIYVRRAAAQ